MPGSRDEEQIGKRIKAMRLRLGLTQEQLGERADLHYSYVGQVERGDKLPSLKSLKKLARALNTNVEVLLEEGEDYLSTSSAELLIRELSSMLEGRPLEDIRLVLEMTRLLLARLDTPDQE
ncbi:hypothetical protein SY88_04785 [Clostridiales bacterium PH28_bin88]|nr:hypothetical protein SY88_04785 [Clostridiales bacterium PH28_bin88]